MSRPGSPRLGFVAAAAASAGIAALLLFVRSRPNATPTLGTESVEVVSGVSMIRGLGPSVAYVIETARGTVLIDAGLQADAARLKAEMSKLRLNWRGVTAVFLTHVHGDHTGGAEAIRAATGARIYAGKGDAAEIRSGASRDAVFGLFYMPNDAPHPTTVDVELTGEEAIDFGDARVHAVATPGHSPGSTCYLVERGGLRILFTGDVVINLGDKNPLGVYSAYLGPQYRGDARLYTQSLERLRALPVPDLILPGHPSATPPFENPRLSQHTWAAILDAGIREMRTLQTRFEADGADFLDGNPKQVLAGLDYLGDFRGNAWYGLVAASKLYLVGRGGGPGVVAFLEGRLRGLGLDRQKPHAVLLTACDTQDAAGLKELVEAYHPRVVTSTEGLPEVGKLCPMEATVISAADLSRTCGFELNSIPLPGQGKAGAAYEVKWEGRTVLFTGRLPVRFDEEMMVNLPSSPVETREATMDFLMSVNRLEAVKPDIWLPTTPYHGQNANLYDEDWNELIASNYRVGHFQLRRAAPGG